MFSQPPQWRLVPAAYVWTAGGETERNGERHRPSSCAPTGLQHVTAGVPEHRAARRISTGAVPPLGAPGKDPVGAVAHSTGAGAHSTLQWRAARSICQKRPSGNHECRRRHSRRNKRHRRWKLLRDGRRRGGRGGW